MRQVIVAGPRTGPPVLGSEARCSATPRALAAPRAAEYGRKRIILGGVRLVMPRRRPAAPAALRGSPPGLEGPGKSDRFFRGRGDRRAIVGGHCDPSGVPGRARGRCRTVAGGRVGGVSRPLGRLLPRGDPAHPWRGGARCRTARRGARRRGARRRPARLRAPCLQGRGSAGRSPAPRRGSPAPSASRRAR